MARRLGCGVLHFGPPAVGVTWVEEYLQPVTQALVNYGSRDVVLDRGFLSEMVWSEYAGPRKGLHWDESTTRAQMLGVFHALTTRIVVLERPLEDIFATLERRGEHHHKDVVRDTLPMYRRHAGALEDVWGFQVTITNPTDWMQQWDTSVPG
jgi:hypothetical protein